MLLKQAPKIKYQKKNTKMHMQKYHKVECLKHIKQSKTKAVSYSVNIVIGSYRGPTKLGVVCTELESSQLCTVIRSL